MVCGPLFTTSCRAMLMTRKPQFALAFTQEIIAAWVAAVEADGRWWNAGGPDCQNNPYAEPYYEAQARLDSLLGIRPWEQSPISAYESDAPPHLTKQAREQWHAAWALRQQLESARIQVHDVKRYKRDLVAAEQRSARTTKHEPEPTASEPLQAAK